MRDKFVRSACRSAIGLAWRRGVCRLAAGLSLPRVFFCLATKETKMPKRPYSLLDFLSLAAFPQPQPLALTGSSSWFALPYFYSLRS